MKKIIIGSIMFLSVMGASAQVKIGNNATTINTNSLLELESTNKGLLLPRVALTSSTSFNPLTAHVAGMSVYNTATAADVTPGFYINNGASWAKVGTPAVSVVTNTSTVYSILGTEDIILSNATAACTMTLPATGVVGKKIVIANKNGAGGSVNIAVAAGGAFWNGSGFLISSGNTFIFTYTGTTSGWINEAVGLN